MDRNSVPKDPYSTLEVDHEHDPAATAPERDGTFSTPQVVPSAGLQTYYDPTLPEAVTKPEAPYLEPDAPQNTPQAAAPARRFTKRTRLILGVVALVAILAIALGVGLGVGLSRRSSSATTSIAPSPTASAGPQAINGTEPGAALRDTSLAVTTTSDGNRHVFFQDSSNTIRQAIYEMSSGQWSASTTYVVATDAKPYSPLSAFEVPSYLAGQEEIHLLYITSNNSVNARIFNLQISSWINETTTYNGITRFTARTGSRALSATRRDNYTSNDLQQSKGAAAGLGQQYPILSSQNFTMYLLFEDTSGTLQWYFGWWGFFKTTNSQNAWQWQWTNLDIEQYGVSQFEQLASSTLTPPFSSSIAPSSGSASGKSDSAYAIKVLSAATSNAGANYTYFDQTFNDTSGTDATVGFQFPGLEGNVSAVDFTQGCVTNGSTSDARVYGFWVNGTTLSSITSFGNDVYPTTSPSSQFPYTRLASTSPGNGTEILLYHQINDTAFAEDVYDTSGGVWSSSSFTISTS
ncbi:hypothetical protein MMC13_007835 [Lambiella insularis]|nr:hypothetical protein [Lambiella insularis]